MLIPLKTLQKRFKVNPTGVLHIGANVGEEAQAYDEIGVKDVVWIEANEQLIPQLKINTQHKYGHKVIHACIGDIQDLEVKFHISNNAGQSSSYLEFGTHKIAHPEVHYVRDVVMKMKRIDGFTTCWGGYDFLNIDLQGAELKALKGMGDLLRQFKWAYLEVNKAELYKGCALVEDIDMYMLAYGFKRVMTEWAGNTGWGDALYIMK